MKYANVNPHKGIEPWGLSRMALKKGVFLCHNTKDKPQVNKIREFLKRRKISAFMDQYDLVHFNLWEEQLISEIKRFKAAAIFLGRSGLGSWQEKEIEMFLSEYEKNPRNRQIALVLLPGCSQQLLDEAIGKWPDLNKWQWTNFNQDDPDPVKSLISGIQPNSSKIKQGYKEELEIEVENRQLRVDIFQIAVNDLKVETEILIKAMERDRSRMRNVQEKIIQIHQEEIQSYDKEISGLVLGLENISPEIKLLEQDLRRCSKGLARLATNFSLDGMPQLQGKEESIEFKEGIDWFCTEIENYIGRICGFLVTSRRDVLEGLMGQRSGFESEDYIKALRHVRELVYDEFGSDQEALEVFDKAVDKLCKEIKFQR